MKDWPALDKVFPFKCNTPDCSEYYPREFLSAALNLGYIWLANENFFIIGLTCPKCLQTTINKYSVDITDFEISQFDNFQNFIPFPSENFKNRVPTPSNTLYHVPPRYLFLDQNLNDFHPKPILNYPEWFNFRCIYYIDENEVPEILKFENKNKTRVFPRIISNYSAYHWTDAFLTYLQNPESLAVELENTLTPTILHNLLINMAKNYLSIGYNVETEITQDRIKDLAIEFAVAQNYPMNFMKTIKELIPEYYKKRSAIDFDLTFKIDFLDKYINKLFYVEDYHKSQIRLSDKKEYENLLGKPEKIEKSQNQEILTSGEILSRWKKESAFLKSVILNGDLCVYGIDGCRFNPTAVQTPFGSFSLDDYIFLKRDVEDLERNKPWLQIEPTDETQDSVTGKDARELGQLKTEKKKWDASIEAAVQIGIWVAEQKGQLKRDEVKDKLDKIDRTIPSTTFEMIWKAIPDKKRHSGGRPKKTEGTE